MKTKLLFLFVILFTTYVSFGQFEMSLSHTTPQCYEDSFCLINVNVTGGVPPYNFSWNTSGQNSPSLQDVGAGYYSVTITDQTGYSDSIVVTLTAPDPVELVVSPDQTIYEGSFADLIAVGFGGNGGPYTYHWTPGAFTSGEILVNPTITTEYCVYAQDYKGCVSSVACVTVFVVPTNRNETLLPGKQQISVYPNPLSNNGRINLDLRKSGFVKIDVLNPNGEIVEGLYAGNLHVGCYSFDIDANDYRPGVYYYRFTRNRESTTKRFVVLE